MIVSNSRLYEGCQRLFGIKCILLCEFHHTAGAKIRCQVPENYISKETFDLINVYIIPKPQISQQRSIITVNTLGYKVVGYPVKIDHQRYIRNAFYFNICFLVDSHRRSIQLESVVKKLSNYFVMMEDEMGFLSKEESTPRIQNMFKNILVDLNERKLSTIVEGETTIYLKIVDLSPDPTPVYDWQVPVLLPQYENIDTSQVDLTTQQVLPFINGINHVSRISSESDVENALVKACIQNLVYYRIVQLLPLFKYCNVYMCTRNLKNLTKDEVLAEECMNFVKLKPENPAPTLRCLLRTYSQMTHGVNLRSLCQRLCPREYNIDERKLVMFGLQKNLIRCIYKYPIFTGSIAIGRQKLYNGKNSLDMIACITGLSATRIEADIDADTNVTVIWK